MTTTQYYIGQRLSLKAQACTIRYIGPVADKSGEWLGVEWDTPGRGKHEGTYLGVQYFHSRNIAPKTGSFLNPNQSWDTPRTFLQALREKYMPEESGTGAQVIYFSSKKAEEVGFDKFARRQAQLQGIFVIVLDRMQLQHDLTANDDAEITSICAHATDLDLGSNLLESMEEVYKLCYLLPKLDSLILNGNRLARIDALPRLDSSIGAIRSLGLSETLLTWREICSIAKSFTSLTLLMATSNQLAHLEEQRLPQTLKTLELEKNHFKCLEALRGLSSCHALNKLVLKNNVIAMLLATGNDVTSPEVPIINSTVTELDLGFNAIDDWAFIDHLPSVFPALKHLRVAGNPLYTHLKAADGRPLSSEDGYMLTIARLPHVETLNFSKITDKERLNAETYYLGQIALEVSLAPAEDQSAILRRHPRWNALCDEYGTPSLQRASQPEVNPHSVAARLVRLTFSLDPTTFADQSQSEWQEQVPRSFNIYFLLGIVGRRLGIMPLNLRLVWVTEEKDPVRKEGHHGELDWWESSDDEEDEGATQLVRREVPLVAGTRPLGTYIDGKEARIRVELAQNGS